MAVGARGRGRYQFGVGECHSRRSKMRPGRPRAGSISMLLLEWLRNAGQPPSSRTTLQEFAGQHAGIATAGCPTPPTGRTAAREPNLCCVGTILQGQTQTAAKAAAKTAAKTEAKTGAKTEAKRTISTCGNRAKESLLVDGRLMSGRHQLTRCWPCLPARYLSRSNRI